jgi:phage-related baseplate assembly protein
MAKLVRAWKAAQAPSAPTPKLRGPEGVQRRIEAAYAAMKAAEEIKHTASMSAHFPALRLRLIAAHPDAGYGATRPTDETLRKTFRDLFRDDAGA